MKKILITLALVAVVSIGIPSISYAAWWNPFTWKIFNRTIEIKPQTELKTENQSTEIEALKKEVEELKKKSQPTNVDPQKTLIFSGKERVLDCPSYSCDTVPFAYNTDGYFYPHYQGKIATTAIVKKNQDDWSFVEITREAGSVYGESGSPIYFKKLITSGWINNSPVGSSAPSVERKVNVPVPILQKATPIKSDKEVALQQIDNTLHRITATMIEYANQMAEAQRQALIATQKFNTECNDWTKSCSKTYNAELAYWANKYKAIEKEWNKLDSEYKQYDMLYLQTLGQ